MLLVFFVHSYELLFVLTFMFFMYLLLFVVSISVIYCLDSLVSRLMCHNDVKLMNVPWIYCHWYAVSISLSHSCFGSRISSGLVVK